jgi:hypothetical protein
VMRCAASPHSVVDYDACIAALGGMALASGAGADVVGEEDGPPYDWEGRVGGMAVDVTGTSSL